MKTSQESLRKQDVNTDTTKAKPTLLTLKLGFHGNVGEASEDRYNLVILLLSQKPQHVSPVRVLQAHQVLNASYLVLRENMRGNIILINKTKKIYIKVRRRVYLFGDTVSEVLFLKVGQLQ